MKTFLHSHWLFKVAFLGLIALVLAISGQPQPIEANNGGYLHTDGNSIRNENNELVAITGVNWFGLETPDSVFHGLWVRNWEDMLDQIAGAGYNTVRIPFSNAVLKPGVMPSSIDANQNPDLVGISSIELLDKVIEGAGQRGLKVILDNHRSDAGVSAQGNGMWYINGYSEDDWVADWEWIVARYSNDDTVIGADLRNEPHDSACWGCGDPALDWRLAAERAGNAVLAVNSDLLIFVEGVECYNPNGSTDPYDDNTDCTWWGGNLMGAKDHPIRLDVPNRLVYSPHEYPASVYPQPWFSDANYPDNLPAVWHKFWGYLYAENTAPLMFGEFGTRYADESDQIWFHAITDYMQERSLSWTYWSWNPNSGDTGGLLQNDWTTIHPDKQAVLEPLQFPFLGLAPTPTPTPDGSGGTAPSLALQYQVGNTSATDGQISNSIQLVNTGTGAASLNGVTLRYWFTADGSGGSSNYYCDYAVMACSNISGNYVALSTPVDGADGYMEIAFNSSAPAIASNGNSGVIQNRFSKADWSNYDESDDYSYNPTQTTLADYDRVTVHFNGQLIWGVAPTGDTPTVTPEPPTATHTPTMTPTPPVPTLVPTDSPGPVCTPPPCPIDGSVYVCGDPNGCPGGCGTICVPPSPTPTDTPEPPTPTATPTWEPTPTWSQDSELALTLSDTVVEVGQTVDLTISVVDHGSCTYHLMEVTIGADPVITPNYIYQDTGQSFTFTATEVGSTTIGASGYGEYYCGSWTWSHVNGTSETITVVEATGPTPTATFTPEPPTPTATFTPEPPTPTATFTPEPPTPTATFTPEPPPPTATPVTSSTCSVAYVLNDWGSGFTADVTITNNDSSPVAGYTLTWDYTGNQQMTGAWNADVVQSGSSFSASNVASAWNGTLAANGGSSTFGFNANYSGSNDAPAEFVLNGVVCN